MAKYGSDESVTKRVPKKAAKEPLAMPMTGRDFKGKFAPRTKAGGGAPATTTRNPVLPPIQPAKKKPLGGVYED